MEKQTAVEWLQDKLNNVKPTQFCSIDTIKEWVEQAKQMEKEQHSNTWTDARIHHKGDDYIGKEISFEQYYNETYVNK